MHYHQMGVHRRRGYPGNLIDNRKAERNVWHKCTVHHVKVDDVAAIIDKPDVLLEMKEIRGEYGWGYLKSHIC